MDNLGLIVSFVVGLTIIILACALLSVRQKSIFRVIISSICGGLILLLLSVFQIVIIPINPLNALLVGLGGVFGLATILVVMLFF